MEAKRRIDRAFYWIDVKLSWLLHFPKPVDWDEFDRKLHEAMEEDARRYKAALGESYEKGYNKALAQLADMTEECKQIGRKEVVEDMTTTLDNARHNYTMAAMWRCLQKWQAKLKEWNVTTE